MKACKWVTSFASQFESFCNTYITAALTTKEMSKEEKEEAEKEAARLALEAAEVRIRMYRYTQIHVPPPFLVVTRSPSYVCMLLW